MKCSITLLTYIAAIFILAMPVLAQHHRPVAESCQPSGGSYANDCLWDDEYRGVGTVSYGWDGTTERDIRPVKDCAPRYESTSRCDREDEDQAIIVQIAEPAQPPKPSRDDIYRENRSMIQKLGGGYCLPTHVCDGLRSRNDGAYKQGEGLDALTRLNDELLELTDKCQGTP